jgi:iron complex outermembrane receptor protein
LRGKPDTSTTYIGFTPNLTFHGRRHVNSAYAELSLPLKKWFEVQLAGRHEYYSDFGHTTKPKISAKLNLPKNKFVNVLVRGSYSESFKAPDIGQTKQARTIASTTLSNDPFRPGDGARTVRVIQGGNPNLQPEQGKIQFIGFVLEFPAVKGLSLSAEYFDHKIRGAILTLTQAFLLSPDGLSQFPNAIRRGPNLATDPAGWPGPITEYDGISQNLGYQLSQTWDFGARYTFRTEHYGSFNVSADATQLIKRGSDSGLGAGFGNATGRYNAPIWRGNYGITWRYGKFNASVTSDVVGKFWNNGFAGVAFGENVYSIVNTSVSYRGFKKTTLTLGANNALNHRPPQNGLASSGFGYDERGVDAIGANGILLTARVRREF